MIEKYFVPRDMQLAEVRDNGTSLTFVCFQPGNTDESGKEILESVTLSDLGLARAYGINPKEHQRSEFVSYLAELFPFRFGQYLVKDWELPIPEEWVENAASYIKSMHDKRIFNTIGGSSLKYLSPPLYRWVVLNATIRMYPTFSPDSKAIPSDLVLFKENPEKLLSDEE